MLIKAYAFSAASDNQSSIKMKIEEIKEGLMNLIENYSLTLKNNDYLKNKLNETI